MVYRVFKKGSVKVIVTIQALVFVGEIYYDGDKVGTCSSTKSHFDCACKGFTMFNKSFI